MARSRRESHHRDGITNQKSPQLTSATKSAQSGHSNALDECPLSAVKQTLIGHTAMSVNDQSRHSPRDLQ
jgi:hypothetical protein